MFTRSFTGLLRSTYGANKRDGPLVVTAELLADSCTCPCEACAVVNKKSSAAPETIPRRIIGIFGHRSTQTLSSWKRRCKNVIRARGQRQTRWKRDKVLTKH